MPELVPYDFVGRFETYTENMAKILDRLDAPADAREVAAKVHNATPQVALAAAYDRALLERLRRDHEEQER